MINHVYQLVSPHVFSISCQDVDAAGQVLVRPRYMAVCHADQRYYQGLRDAQVLRKKLPMALIHECCGEVLRGCFGKIPHRRAGRADSQRAGTGRRHDF